jgi:DNA-binding ferritin-like protein
LPNQEAHRARTASHIDRASEVSIYQNEERVQAMANENTPAGASPAQSETSLDALSEPANKSGGESLDKVRDILFGSQSREYEKRFARLEERLLKESADLREDLKRRFDTLELYIKKEVESLAARLKTEQDERAESARGLSAELNETARGFEKKTGQLGEHLTASERELRQQILEQSKNLSDEIRQKHESVTTSLERATSELRDEKTDRAALASLFMEVAMRLNNEFKIPRAEDLE